MTDTQPKLFENSEPKKKRRTRKRDDVYEALVHVFYPSGVSKDKNERGRVNQLVERARAKLLPGIHKQAAIAALEERKRRYQVHKTFRDCPCTAKAVLGNWDVVGKDPLIQLREDCHGWAARHECVRELHDNTAEMYVYLEVVGNAGGLRKDKAVQEVARRQWLQCVRHFGSLEMPNPHNVCEATDRYRMFEAIRAAVKELT
ncbi:MAG: hypothetical protein KAV00_01930 [Phycisphaerae bacterium]|nr:hypothetical protein [Phycisphaerae bacterium]